MKEQLNQLQWFKWERHTLGTLILLICLGDHWESLTEKTELQRELAERFVRPLMWSHGSGVLLRWFCCCSCGCGLQPPPPLGRYRWSSGCVLLLPPPPWSSCRCSGGRLLVLPPQPPLWRSSLLPPWYSCVTLVIPGVRSHTNWPSVSSTTQSASVRAGAISISQSGVFLGEILHNQLKSIDACCVGITVVQCAGTLMKNWDVQISLCSLCFISKRFWKLLLGDW